MSKRRADHVSFRNGGMFCYHCGTPQVVPFPIAIDMMVAMGKQFTKSHKDCEKRWEQPWPDMALSETERIDFWHQHGEHGASSEWMSAMLDPRRELDDFIPNACFPYDADDFSRCHQLLKMVPELRERMHRLRKHAPEWDRLAQHWDELTALFEAKDPKFHALMKELIR